MDHPHALYVVLIVTKMVGIHVSVHMDVLIDLDVFPFWLIVDTIVAVLVVFIGDLFLDTVHF